MQSPKNVGFLRPWKNAPAALVGYVEYPVVGLVSGLAPLSTLDRNASTLLDACIVPGTGPATPLFSGRLVRLLNPQLMMSAVLLGFAVT